MHPKWVESRNYAVCEFSRSHRRQRWIGARILELVRKISIQRSMETCWTQNIYAKHSEWWRMVHSRKILRSIILLFSSSICIRFRSLENLARKRWCVRSEDECVWVRARLCHGIRMESKFLTSKSHFVVRHCVSKLMRKRKINKIFAFAPQVLLTCSLPRPTDLFCETIESYASVDRSVRLLGTNHINMRRKSKWMSEWSAWAAEHVCVLF